MAMLPSGSAAASMCARPPPTTLLRPRSPPLQQLQLLRHGRARADVRCRRRLMTARGEGPPRDDEEEQAGGFDAEEEEEESSAGFDAAVALFNRGDFHACHDVVEELWYSAEDPARTLLHGILQCAVGFHHLFNQNHRGAMMELGEGLCKLRKLHLNQDDGGEPFSASETRSPPCCSSSTARKRSSPHARMSSV